jgi:uncharacterized damage-inducible protein DinB
MTIAALINEYSAGPAELRKLVAGLSAEQIRARPIPGKWSTLEVVCHLADFEPVVQDRPTFYGRDENAFAAKFAYHERDLAEELNLIESCRQSMARILRTLPAADFQRLGVHNEAGEMTFESLLRRVTGHLTHHAKFIAEKRAALGS